MLNVSSALHFFWSFFWSFWFSWLRTHCALEALWDSVFGAFWGRCGNLYLLLKSPLDRIVVHATQVIVLLRGTAKHLRLLILCGSVINNILQFLQPYNWMNWDGSCSVPGLFACPLWLPRFGFRPSDPPVDAVHMIFAVLSTLL